VPVNTFAGPAAGLAMKPAVNRAMYRTVHAVAKPATRLALNTVTNPIKV
jgi:hypothetical protein